MTSGETYCAFKQLPVKHSQAFWLYMFKNNKLKGMKTIQRQHDRPSMQISATGFSLCFCLSSPTYLTSTCLPHIFKHQDLLSLFRGSGQDQRQTFSITLAHSCTQSINAIVSLPFHERSQKGRKKESTHAHKWVKCSWTHSLHA